MLFCLFLHTLEKSEGDQVGSRGVHIWASSDVTQTVEASNEGRISLNRITNTGISLVIVLLVERNWNLRQTLQKCSMISSSLRQVLGAIVPMEFIWNFKQYLRWIYDPLDSSYFVGIWYVVWALHISRAALVFIFIFNYFSQPKETILFIKE